MRLHSSIDLCLSHFLDNWQVCNCSLTLRAEHKRLQSCCKELVHCDLGVFFFFYMFIADLVLLVPVTKVKRQGRFAN